MPHRLELQELLEELLGSNAVYFQPPPTVQMKYPSVVYKLDDLDTKFANNLPYHHEPRYQVTVIDKDPDSLIPGKVAALPKCLFDRHFIADNLNHFVFNLFF